MEVLEQLNVRVVGSADAQPMLFAHGFGCDQDMWRYVTPELSDFRVVLFDAVGCGKSAVARQWASVTFRSDNRADLPHIFAPTLILQCEYDAIAPKAVGRYVHEQIPGSTLQLLDVAGHCPNLSNPQLTAAAIRSFVDELRRRT